MESICLPVSDYLENATEAISGALEDFHWEQTSKRDDKLHLADKLIRLRAQKGWTRKVAAEAAGIPEYSLRNYELMKSVPKEEHLAALANAYGVRVESLHFYNFVDLELVAPAFFQMADTYGLEPFSSGSYSALRPTSGFMKRFLKKWAVQYACMESDDDRVDYERWKDNFYLEFEPSEFPAKYETTPEGGWKPMEPWQGRHQALKMKALRERRDPPYTQAELAAASGVSLGALRGYEQGVRVPKRVALTRIAECLGVTRGALVFTDFGSPVQAAHALFQLAGDHSLSPHADGDEAFLVARGSGPECFISMWAKHRDGDDPAAFQKWKDTYRYLDDAESGWE